jgi:hypothetical protein
MCTRSAQGFPCLPTRGAQTFGSSSIDYATHDLKCCTAMRKVIEMPWHKLYRTAGGGLSKVWVDFWPDCGVMFFDPRRQNRNNNTSVCLFVTALREERCFDRAIRDTRISKGAFLDLRGWTEAELDAEIEQAIEYYRSHPIVRAAASGAPEDLIRADEQKSNPSGDWSFSVEQAPCLSEDWTDSIDDYGPEYWEKYFKP